ncbi:cytochrome c biogenesis CcdA family protein [Demequina sp.]|uniref:cytochrome c biogenesis CcdA family protein n=1 Tax=Demequina sp. TaxID=2050685 RepID=UPI0025C49194|nr:cytochrome c biogenesis CcdA family protein [Demequina sp.]
MIDGTSAAFALLLGAVAAFNPCGFALLPAYITVIVTGSADDRLTRAQSLRRAVVFGLAMTAGFVAVFTGFGLLFGAVNVALQGSVLPYLPYVTVALGVVLIGFGVAMALGHEIPGLRVRSVAGHAPRADAWSQVLYGVSFALASLSCTIAPFFAVVTQSLDASNPVGAVAPFVIYGAGMGTAVLMVSLAAAFAGAAVGRALRKRTGAILRAGGVIMVLAGLWVIVYGLAELLPRYGVRALDEVLLGSSRIQGDISSAITDWGTPVLVTLVSLVVAAVVVVFVLARRDARRREHELR